MPDSIASRLHDLPAALRDHVERARTVAQELAIRHGVDARQADIGAAAHDLARAVRGSDLRREAKRLGLNVSFVEHHQPQLLHGPVAAAWLTVDDGYEVEPVVESVRVHTTGKSGMGDIAKVVFLADKLDPWKVARAPFLNRVADLARSDLDAAILEYLDRTAERLIGNGQMVHPTAIEFRNELIAQIRRR